MGNDNYKQGSDFFKKEKSILDFPTKSLQNTLTVSVNSNSDAERRAALPGEVLLLLFGSLQRGCGRIMMEAFESECRKNGVGSYLLWTDETCDFEYYRKNRFTAVAHFPCAAAIKGKHLETWLFRKTL